MRDTFRIGVDSKVMRCLDRVKEEAKHRYENYDQEMG